MNDHSNTIDSRIGGASTSNLRSTSRIEHDVEIVKGMTASVESTTERICFLIFMVAIALPFIPLRAFR